MEQDFVIIEPIELTEMLERNYVVSKPAIEAKALAFVDTVLQNGNPLAIVENLSAIKLFIKQIEGSDKLNEYVLEELGKDKGKVTLATGTKIERIEAGTTYDFTACADEVLNRLEWAAKAAADAVKARKEFLKKVPVAGMVVVNEESGEVGKIWPPLKTSTTTYKITLPAKDNTPEPFQDLPF